MSPPRRPRSSNITKLPSGRFQWRGMLGGKRVKESFDTLAQAEQFRDAIDLDQRLKKHGMPGIIKSRPRLRDVIRDFLAGADDRVKAGTLTQGTCDHYWQCSAGWKRWLADGGPVDLRADELDDALVLRYIAWRQGRKLTKKASRVASDVQVRKDLTHLVRVFRWAGLERSWSIPRTLRKHKGGKRVVTPEQLFAFLEAMPEGSPERTVAELAIATGMRPSDLYALDVGQVDLLNRVIRTVTQKDRKVLVLPIEDYLVRQLELWLARRMPAVHGRLFHLNGRPIDRHTFRVRYRKASKVAGIEPAMEFVGSLRNAFVSYLRDEGVSWDDLSEFVGHNSTATTRGYARSYISLKSRQRVAKKVDELRSRTGLRSEI